MIVIYTTVAALFTILTGTIIYLFHTLKTERRYIESVCLDQSITNDDLNESQQRFKAFYESAFEGLAMTRDQIFIDCNPQLAAMFGYCRDELIGQPVSMLVFIDDRDKVKGYMQSDYAQRYQHRTISKTGDIGTVEVCGKKIVYQGQTVRMTAVHDVTAQNKAMVLLDKLKGQEHQASKMEAIGNFAAGIAHDFNNTLSPIIGHAGVLLLEITDGPQRQAVESILKAADLASQLVHRIQTFSKIDYTPALKPIDVTTVIEETTAFLRSIIPTTVKINSTVAPALVKVMAAEITIKQILLNLCKNSAQAIGEKNGTITITVENLVCKTPTETHHAGRYLRLRVADDGRGMDPVTLSQAKAPYFSTKKTGKNTGLGLTIVHGIADSYNACLEINSRLNQGTCVQLDIPAATDKQIQTVYNNEALMVDDGPVTPGNGQNILFCDDESYMVDVVKNVLASLNYNVTGFDNSVDAWDEFRKHPKKYKVVISDVTMPTMTGVELIQAIKTINPKVKTILCSGLGSNFRSEKAVAAEDIDVYMTKPAGREKFARVLTNLLQ